jgi:hypothetical protein
MTELSAVFKGRRVERGKNRRATKSFHRAAGDVPNDRDISAAGAELDLLIDIHSHAGPETRPHRLAYHIVV